MLYRQTVRAQPGGSSYLSNVQRRSCFILQKRDSDSAVFLPASLRTPKAQLIPSSQTNNPNPQTNSVRTAGSLPLPPIPLHRPPAAIRPVHMPARPRRRLLSLLRRRPAPVRADVAPHEVVSEMGIPLAELAVSHFLLAHLAFPAHLLFPVEGGLLLLR